MPATIVRRSRVEAGRKAQPPLSPLPSPVANDDEGDQGGTSDDVPKLYPAAAVRAVVRKTAFVLLMLEQLVPPDELEAWGDNVRPAVDLLFRYGSGR